MLTALFGLNNRATRRADGISCFNNCNRLVAVSGPRAEIPVTFLPGCARLATNPARTGSPTAAINNWDCLGRCLGSLRRGRARCNDDVHWDAGELLCSFCYSGGLGFIGYLTFGIPEVTHGFAEVTPIRRVANH